LLHWPLMSHLVQRRDRLRASDVHPVIRPRRSKFVDATCYGPSSVICQSGTVVSPAKTAEPIEMP